jgi:hypothetical protein
VLLTAHRGGCSSLSIQSSLSLVYDSSTSKLSLPDQVSPGKLIATGSYASDGAYGSAWHWNPYLVISSQSGAVITSCLRHLTFVLLSNADPIVCRVRSSHCTRLQLGDRIASLDSLYNCTRPSLTFLIELPVCLMVCSCSCRLARSSQNDCGPTRTKLSFEFNE